MADEEKLRDYLRRAIAEAHESKTRLQEVTSRASEPIAVIGMSCRFPGGADTPEDLWRILADGVDTVTDPPADRGWDTDALQHPDPDHPGTAYTLQGAFLDRAAAFDADFFGISPREAVATDPQQRLMLEIAWEAAERAGIDPRSLHGGDTGTFIGGYDAQYGEALGRQQRLEGHAVTGLSPSVLSGRIAYQLGLEGPSVTIDSACSSSLVAIHLAVQALRRGECGLAYAGGVALLLSPDLFVMFSRQRGMAADGRSKAFADAADGVGWGEGAGMLMLERLSDARRNNHPVLAVVRGSALNSDGASNGLTAPNGPSQQRMISAALADAGLSPREVDAVEAHGTGTTLGDPIEAQALLETYGQDRTEPLYVGSIKSNIGHTQNAGGVAGVIKMILAMRSGVLPPTLHVDMPSTHVDWTAGSVSLLTEARPWPETGRPMRAGVSAFGISGTNAHILLEQAPEEEPATEPDEPVARPEPSVLPIPLSGRTPEVLRAVAARATQLESDSLADVAYSYATTRSDFAHRAVVLAADMTEARTGIAALAAGTPHSTVLTGVADGGRTAALFSGQGAQRIGMGRELYERFPLFAEALDAVLAEFPGLREVMWGTDETALHQTGWAQPALFAVEVALYQLLTSWGVVPDQLAGHSIGELAAAYVAGVFSLPDACQLVGARARLMQQLPEGGAMVAVRATEDEVVPLLADPRLRDGVALAAVNGPESVVLSGTEDAVAEVLAAFPDRKTTRLRVSHAFHSPLMDPMLAEFRQVAEGISYHPPAIPLVSTRTGGPVSEEICSAEYWVSQVRDTVRFADAVTALRAAGTTRFVEVGPDAALCALLPDDVLAVALLRRDRDEERTAITGLARLYVAGLPIRAGLFAGLGARTVELPTYPFQHQDFWPEPVRAASATLTGDSAFWQLVDGNVEAFADALELSSTAAAEVLPALTSWRERQQAAARTDSWRYRVDWTPLRGTTRAELTGHWLLVHPDNELQVSVALAAALRAAGAEVRLLPVACAAEIIASDVDVSTVDVVVSLLALDARAEEGTAAVPAGLAGTVRLLRALDAEVPVWALTTGAVTTGSRDVVSQPLQATLWGLGRVAAIERPAAWAGLVDLPETVDERTMERLIAVLAGEFAPEDQLAVRSWGVFGRRLVRAPSGKPGAPSRTRLRGTVLITGGSGGLGGVVARWAADSGAQRLVLLSRSGCEPPASIDIPVSIVRCDVTDREALASVLDEYRPNAVVHAAGTVLGDGPAAEVTPAQLDELLAAKLAARHLHELTEDLDAFVLFGSAAGVWGSAGMAGYSAGNAYLDALAEHRAAAGLPATSVGWGTWADVGLAAEHRDASRKLDRFGVRELDPAGAIEVLDQVVVEGRPTLVVAEIDWTRFAPSFTARRPSPLLDVLSGPQEPAERVSARPTLPADPDAVLELVRGEIAAVLGHADTEAITPNRALAELGFDSLTAVELRDRLAATVGAALPSTMVFDYPNAGALAAFLTETQDDGTSAETPRATRHTEDPVVIVGMSCRLPGDITSPAELWRMLLAEETGVSAFPTDRGWDLAGLAAKSSTTQGGFLAGAANFDAEFFGISPREAIATDPQQRLLLETTWEAIEAAGIDPTELRGTRTGVFVGGSGQDYLSLLGMSEEETAGHAGIGNAASVLSGRIAYLLGLEGPAVTVDTACSSSLVALHLAARALRDGECDRALVGGVTVMSTANTFVEFSVQGGLAADGLCKAFSDDADGTGWSEGVGALMLTRRSDAERAGYPVLAVVRGSAMNSDGASNGLTAPNGPSQQRVIRAALASAGLSASDVDVVEAHGTGTTLGDPIEAQALLATYGQDREIPLLLGSVKSNLGHTQAAAGVTGVIKAVLALRSGTVPASLHAATPSSHVDWNTGDVELVTTATPWPATGRVRRAGVSAFGVSGTNAHVLLEQATDLVVEHEASRPTLVPWVLSGHTASALADRERQLTTVAAPPAEVGAALVKRAALAHRSVLLSTSDSVVAAARGVAGDPGRLALLFAGQGAQRLGMGRELYERFPVFATAFDDVVDALDARSTGSVREILWGSDEAELTKTGWAQPALFALEVALFRLVESFGVRPSVLAGHSIGEIAAAHVAGVFSLDDACTLVSARARLMQALPDGGAMVAVRAAEDELTLTDGVAIAAVNDSDSVVLSGVADEVLTAVGERKYTRLRVSHAFHSPLMDPMLDEFREAITGIEFGEPTIQLVKDVGSVDYWVNHVRDTVRFADDLAATEADTFLEIGPDATLSALADGIPTLRKDQGEETALLTALARLHVTGVQVNWKALFTGIPPAELPPYPFQHQRYWPTLPTTEQPIASWTYQEVWRPHPELAAAQPAGTAVTIAAADHRWLAVVPPEPDAWTSAVATALGAETVTVHADMDHAELTAALAAAAPTGVLSLLATGSSSTATPFGVTATVRLLRALAETSLDAPLWTLTRAAVATTHGEVPGENQAAVLGLGRTAALEYPVEWGGLLDLPAELTAGALANATAVLASGGAEDQLAVRESGVYVRRLVPAELPSPEHWRPAGTVLITGGTGALGRRIALRLAELGAEHLVLVSRSGHGAPGSAELQAELAETGVQVTLRAADAADREQMAEILAEHPVDAVVHAAGVVHDGIIDGLEDADVEAMFHAKVSAARVLDELTADRDLDAFVLFSSAAGILGKLGQAGYAAANAELCALAARRRAAGRPAIALGWGAWSGDGMAAHLYADLPLLDPEAAVGFLTVAALAAQPALLVLDLTDRRLLAGHRHHPQFAELPDVAEAPPAPVATLRDPAVLLDAVRGAVTHVLGHASSADIDVDRPFRDLGFDSLTAVELRNQLTALTGISLPAGTAFDFPTVRQLTDHLTAQLSGEDTDTAVAAATVDEPIAIIAMACRFPGGVDSPARLWQLLADGVDATGPLPTDRGWDHAELATGAGGFLADVAGFDAGFFGISPREALAMDPQQRLLLETTWEGFERAGIDPAAVRGSRTGVFVGTNGQDYFELLRASPDDTDGHAGTGMATSVLAGRIAYTFGLEGPAMTVDTACSSSLVALHLAAESLRRGECDLAFAGGVTVMSTAGPLTELGRQGALSPDGRCKAFADGADGAGFAEGIGMLLVTRLSVARRAGYPVAAIVKGSAVNQDGASNGLTAPNGPAQQRVINQALANAGLSGSDIDVVEAHGTGTALGDPIEAEAVLNAYGQGRETPLWLGSVKSNLGHTQAAAGVAGVLKIVLAMRHRLIPRTLHVAEPSSHVDWSAGTVSVLGEAVPWGTADRPMRAGVSSFGISGTNAHVVLEEPPPVASTEQPVDPPAVPYLLSARTPAALSDLAERLSDVAEDPVAVAAALGSRTQFSHRAVVLGKDTAELTDGLRALAEERPMSAVVTGEAVPERRVVLVFPGQGAQWAGMGAALLDQEPVFAEAIEECAAALEPYIDWSLHGALRADGDLDRVDVVQPASWAMMIALARLWAAYGVHPDAVIGHSQGEIAAAVLAGSLSIQDAARVVALRSKAIARHLAGRGAMISIAEPVEAVIARLSRFGERASIAAINGPTSVVVSGEPSALAELVAECVESGVRAKTIPVDYASHSVHVEDIRDVLLAELADITPHAAVVPFRSTRTGDWNPTADAEYWYDNLRGTVGLHDAVRALVKAGHDTFIEVSPHPVLTLPIQDSAGPDAAVFGTLRRDDGGADRMLRALAEAHTRGVRVDWPTMPGGASVIGDLPTYPFQRERYWPTAPTPAREPVDGLWAALDDPTTFATDLGLPAELITELAPALRSWRTRQHAESTVNDWRYRAEWRPIADTRAQVPDGTWLLVTTESLAEAAEGTEVVSSFADADVPLRVLRLDEADLDRTALADRLPPPEEIAGVVSVLAAAEEPSTTHPDLALGLALTITLIQAFGDAGWDAPVWALTRGAVSTGDTDPLTNPIQAQVLGVGWTAALEHPHRWGGVIDLPAELDDRAASRLLTSLAGGADADQLAIRATGIHARRVVRAPATGAPRERWSPQGTVLVTGGTGQLGPSVVRWLLDNGAKDIVLTSRAEREAGFDERVELIRCDITDRAALAELITELAETGRPVRTVVHAAAVIELAGLAETTLTDFARVVAPKVSGARNLHELATDAETFLLYSSNAGLWGSGEHAAYVAGNAYLSALAQHRRSADLPATAIHWGKWPDSREVLEQFGSADPFGARRTGLRHLDTELAMTALQRALDDRETALALVDVDWARYYPVFSSGRSTTLFAEIPEVAELAREQASATLTTELVDRLRPVGPAERRQLLLGVVRAEAIAVLGYTSVDALPERTAFREVGFDSVTAIDLRNRLTAATGVPLPATLVFDHPNPLALADYLCDELLGTTELGVEETTGTTRAEESDPIVIVSTACRFPGGVSSAEELWRLVADGVDAVGPAPVDRGWDTPAVGGFLTDIAGFDATFFGISPREALAMDPQQRLLLETTWEAVELAGIDMGTLRGTATGVFFGGSYQEYGEIDADVHSVTGVSPALMSGRVAYLFGLEGPAVTLDTGCSSALTALHLACQSLRSGESSLALAGGVTVMASPVEFGGFGELGALSAEGRCKAFGAGADGMGLSEGVGVLLLERLSDARRNGHPVRAVVRGSAMNQDGASNGLTAPNGPSQQRVIRAALGAAGLSGSDIDVVEAHGTGTALGDPIEAGALLATYGRDRATPLYLGSVKSNIGHAQLASGAASLIKMIESLRHAVLPRTLHAEQPSPHIDWSTGALQLLTENTAWPDMDRPRRAAVSSFGISGTNVHVILEQAEVLPHTEPPTVHTPIPWPLSGHTEEAMRAVAALLADIDQSCPADVGWSLVTGRQDLDHRAVVIPAAGADIDSAEAHTTGLHAVAEGKPAHGVVTGAALPGSAGPVFVFPGQGTQWWGMGVGLLENSPVFRETMTECAEALAPYVDWSLLDVVTGTGDDDLLSRVDVVQPALFAMMVSLAAVWRAHGVEPAAVVGHSQGEIAAAYVAGALSLADAAAIVALRSKALLPLCGRGGMVSLSCGVDRAGELIAPWGSDISVAAVNGPQTVVVAGAATALDELVPACVRAGVRARRIAVDYASHSTQVAEIHAELAEALGRVSAKTADVPFYSTVRGERIDTTILDAEYWYQNLRSAVRFEDAVSALVVAGHHTFIETSPHPVLTAAVGETLEVTGTAGTTVGTLRRDQGGQERLLTSFAEAWVSGVDVDWTSVYGNGRRRIDLPTYPFQRRRYWWERGTTETAAPGDTAFWDLVSAADVESLATALDVDIEVASQVAPGLAAWRDRAAERELVDSWRYQVRWTQLGEPTGGEDGAWLVVLPEGHSTDEWVSSVLAALGDRVRPVVASPLDRAELTARIAAAAEELASADAENQPKGVVSLLGIQTEPASDAADVPVGLLGTLAVIQSMVDVGLAAPLWCLTRCAVSTGEHDPLQNPVQASVWGLGRVAGLELPSSWGGLIDLPETIDDRIAGQLRGVLGGTEDQVAVRPSGAFGRRLTRAPAGQTETIRTTGTMLITGGTGGVGGEVARWAAKHGAEHLLLTSRRGPDAPGASELAEELRAAGTRVTVTACDIADRADVTRLLAAIPDELPLTSVFHAAGGVGQDAEVRQLGTEGLAALFGPKVAGARHLHELTRDLAHFVLFSSGAAVWGSGHQPGYAAANAYLDALAEYRNAQGQPATSVAWGAWGKVGIAARAENDEQLSRRGVLAMDPAHAVTALRLAIEDGAPTCAVSSMDWSRFAPSFTALRSSPLLAELPEVRALTDPIADPVESSTDRHALLARLDELSIAERERELLEIVRAEAGVVLGFAAGDTLPTSRPFRDFGLDSVTAVELRNRLGSVTGLTLPGGVVFDYPTANALATHLCGELYPDVTGEADAADPDAHIRSLLTSIPISRLRQAGVLDLVLSLVPEDGQASEGDAEDDDVAQNGDSLDELDGEDLLRLADEITN
ncbi:acyl transferase domain-containing protein [Tamaricihabitans halophyticus]|uniref:6-deoxyerythronolide-B synthase n=1 Tax=Tamaricihabitans halophyticus TaxID=1262583 RepID=A0A4R2Q7X4_9PSEU|nr:type I polyketide synthase [Tamaricihabitans halophyticus]TCP45033.1 acyl transferase domain-containing protein [Tamaricihabitans halophyticus]